MEIKLIRKYFTNNSTIGELLIDGVFFCYVLEDKVRDFGFNGAGKIKGKTAIPFGKYDVVINFSNRFQKYMPQVLNVPFFEGIRIHPGNTAEDTEGCLLVGKTKGVDVVGQSVDAYRALMVKLQAVEKTEKIFITIS